MTGARRRWAWSPAHVFFPLSVLVLLALAFFPALAGADSSGIQYSDAPPTVDGKEPVHHESPAKSSKSPNGGASAPSNTSDSKDSHSSGDDSSASSTSSKSDAAPSGSTNSNDDGGTGSQGSGGKDASGGSGQGVQDQSQASGKQVSATSEGGSSPLVPILAVIAVLAAISFGAMMFRQRRQRSAPGSSVSPKAS